MDLKELESGVDPHTHWYYQTKKLRLISFFKAKIALYDKRVTLIDVGAGSGFFSLELYKLYPRSIARILLVDLHYTDREVEQTKGQVVQKIRNLPDSIENSIIIMMDVLEHIEDDVSFLKDVISRVKGRCYFFVTVPAFRQLWSGHDVFLGHFRRYSLSEIKHSLIKANFFPRKSYYQFGMIFPIVYFLRKLANKSSQAKNDMKPVNPVVNEILKQLLGIEMLLTQYNHWFGLTSTVEGYIEQM